MKFLSTIFFYLLIISYPLIIGKAEENKLYYTYEAELKPVEDYLNSISTLKASVSQVDSMNRKSEGIMLIKRPNKLAIDFYSGHLNARMIANGKIITIYDRQMEETTYANAHKTAANILLKSKIEFSKTELISVKKDRKSIIITFYLSPEEKENIFKLQFIYAPSPQLHKIEVIDKASKSSTSLTLLTHQLNPEIKDESFILKDKRIFNSDNNQQD